MPENMYCKKMCRGGYRILERGSGVRAFHFACRRGCFSLYMKFGGTPPPLNLPLMSTSTIPVCCVFPLNWFLRLNLGGVCASFFVQQRPTWAVWFAGSPLGAVIEVGQKEAFWKTQPLSKKSVKSTGGL